MATQPTPYVWAVLVHGEGDGAVVGAPTRLHFTVGLPHDVDALKDAAKAKFVQLPANVAASQLSVSVTRGWDKLNEDALVDSLPQGATRQQPLYIHAPAPPQEEEEGAAEDEASAIDRAHGWFSSSSVFFHHVMALVCLVVAVSLMATFQGWVVTTLFVTGAIFSQSCRILVPVHSNFFERTLRS